jgi:DNA-binding GntR family transcriptional regulator
MRTTVYDKLKAAILSGELVSGAPLVELQLAEAYGVSRTPIREALHRLQQDGMVERGDRGLRVAERSAEQIMEIYEARIALEEAACGAAARRRSDVDLARLEGLLAHHPADADDGEAKAVWNRQFHEAVWTASHNRMLVEMLTRLFTHLRRYPSTTLTFPGRWDESIAEHRSLVAAIEQGDEDTARRIGREHMTRARDVRLRMWRDEQTPNAALT